MLSCGKQRINHILFNIPDFIWGHAVTHYAIIEVNFVTVCFFLYACFQQPSRGTKSTLVWKQLLNPLTLESYLSLLKALIFLSPCFFFWCANATWLGHSLHLHSFFVLLYVPSLLLFSCCCICRHLEPSSFTWCPQTGTCPWPVSLQWRCCKQGIQSSTSQTTGETPLYGNNKPLVVSSPHVHFHRVYKELRKELSTFNLCSLFFNPCKSPGKKHSLYLRTQHWGLVTPH